MPLTKEQEFGIAIKGTLGYLRDLVEKCGYKVIYEEENKDIMKWVDSLLIDISDFDIEEEDETFVITDVPYNCINDIKEFVKKLNDNSDLNLKLRCNKGRRRYCNSSKTIYIHHVLVNEKEDAYIGLFYNKHGMPYNGISYLEF